MRRERGRGARGRRPALARLSARLEARAERTEGTRQQQVIEQLGKLMFGDEWRAQEREAAEVAAGGPSPAKEKQGLRTSAELGAGDL